MHELAIELLSQDLLMKGVQAKEFEQTADPHAINQVRAESIRRAMAEIKQSIEVLQQARTGTGSNQEAKA
jgi:hypothetical protein